LAAKGKTTRSSDPLFVQSVEKALKVLAAFGAARPSMSISQIALAANLDRSAAQRFTYTLESLGYLVKDIESKRYSLTTKALDIGHSYIRSNTLIDYSLQYLMHLSMKIQEGVNLSILDKTEVVVISRITSHHMLNNNPTVGTRLPAYCTAAGIAILSRLPRDEAMEILKKSDLQKLTPHTVYQLPDLSEKLDRTLAQGYAVTCQERQANDISIAAPVLDASGDPVAAVTIAVSRLNYTAEETVEKFSGLVLATANAISMNV